MVMDSGIQTTLSYREIDLALCNHPCKQGGVSMAGVYLTRYAQLSNSGSGHSPLPVWEKDA
ncbi:hypothetical protein [Hoylesella timonensis]